MNSIARCEYMRRWREANREKMQEYYKKYNEENKEKLTKQAKQRYKKISTDPNAFTSSLLNAARRRAKEHKLAFNITKNYLYNLLVATNGKCSLSGLPLTTKRKSPFIASVDRINSNRGYVRGNVQIVASCVNFAKSDLKQEDFISMCAAVVEHNRR